MGRTRLDSVVYIIVISETLKLLELGFGSKIRESKGWAGVALYLIE
jgi:hypothetical protein